MSAKLQPRKKFNPKDYVATREPVYLPKAVLDILSGKKTEKKIAKVVQSSKKQPAQGMTPQSYANTKLDLARQRMESMLKDPNLTPADEQSIRTEITKLGIMQVRLNNQRVGRG